MQKKMSKNLGNKKFLAQCSLFTASSAKYGSDPLACCSKISVLSHRFRIRFGFRERFQGEFDGDI
jgi:hypothetical protein